MSKITDAVLSGHDDQILAADKLLRTNVMHTQVLRMEDS